MMPAHRPDYSRGKSVSALGMCLLMVLVSLSAMVPPATEYAPQHQGGTGAKHGAAMELAPSKEPMDVIEDILPEEEETVDRDAPAEVVAEPEEPSADGTEEMEENIRVRILETMPEPIMDSSGEPLSLEAGDVHFLDEATAAWLVDAGVAERAAL